MHAGNVISLVKRTLFEANSKARRFEKQSLTSAQTGGFYSQDLETVNPATPNICTETGAWPPCDSKRSAIFFRRTSG